MATVPLREVGSYQFAVKKQNSQKAVGCVAQTMVFLLLLTANDLLPTSLFNLCYKNRYCF
jgi:hypothetical protein